MNPLADSLGEGIVIHVCGNHHTLIGRQAFVKQHIQHIHNEILSQLRTHVIVDENILFFQLLIIAFDGFKIPNRLGPGKRNRNPLLYESL